MKAIYLSAASLLIIGSMNAQNLMKSASRPVSYQPYGTHSVITPLTLRSIEATLNETFEGAVPPAGWAATNWVSSATTTSTTYDEAAATGHATHFAVFDSYNPPAGTNGSLVTPNLQPVSGTNTLSYSVNVYNIDPTAADQGTGVKLFIEFSTNNGSTWTTSTTNVVGSLTNYNTATNTGWITQTVSLAAYNGMNVMVRFRAVSDYGWSDLGIDNVTGPAVLSLTNDIAANPGTMTQIDGFDYFEVIPNSQLVEADFGVVATNNGSAAQTNVTLNANINAGAYTSSAGFNNPITSLASGAYDTLWTSIMPSETTPTLFEVGLGLTQTQTDELPANNMADSAFFISSDYSFFRTLEISSILSSYSFGAAAPAITGMEYGATYITPNSGRVDSISALIYKSAGAGHIVGKLYTIDPTSGAFTNVASTTSFAPAAGINMAGNLTTLALTTPYVVAAGTLLVATVQLNITPGTDSIYVGSDNAFPGDAQVAGAAYVKPASGAFQWATVTGQVPIVGIQMQNGTTGINEHTTADAITVYPNPSTGVITVNSGAAAKSTVEVYNVVGALVFAKEFNSESNTIDLSAFGKGMYSVKVTTNNTVSVKKVMITK